MMADEAMATPEPHRFKAAALYRSVIAVPLLEQMGQPRSDEAAHRVVIDLNLDYQDGVVAAADVVRGLIEQIVRAKASNDHEGIDERDADIAQYVIARLTADSIRELVFRDSAVVTREAGYVSSTR